MKCLICELIHPVWISMRLNNLIARFKKINLNLIAENSEIITVCIHQCKQYLFETGFKAVVQHCSPQQKDVIKVGASEKLF